MKILLIDDEQALLKVFAETLETLGHFEVVTAQTGNEGLEKVKTEQPDLVLLDQVLPDINGNQILQMIKQDPSTKNVPVAMLSNFNQDNLVQEAINLGALDYILKYQVEPEDLVAKINKLVKEYVKQPAIENAIPIPAIKPMEQVPTVQVQQPEPATPIVKPVEEIKISSLPPTPPTPAPAAQAQTQPTQPMPTGTQPIPTIPPINQPQVQPQTDEELVLNTVLKN